MTKRIVAWGVGAASVLLAGAHAVAAPITFFGEDLNPGGAVPSGGNAETARNSFLEHLVAIDAEDFETVPNGTTPPFDLMFRGTSGDIIASLVATNGQTQVTDLVIPVDQFPTSGSRRLDTNADAGFSISFSTPISAFGFYATDMGDAGPRIALLLDDGQGGSLEIPHSVRRFSGSLVFFGFVDPTQSYSSIRLTSSTGAGDRIGFDDVVAADRGQIVPEPTTFALFAVGLVSLVALRRRRRISRAAADAVAPTSQ